MYVDYASGDDELTAQRIIPYLKVPDEGVVRLVPRAPGLVENNRRTGSLFSKFLVAALMCEHARYARKLSQNVGIFPRYVLPNMPKQQDWRKVKIRGRKSPMDQKQWHVLAEIPVFRGKVMDRRSSRLPAHPNLEAVSCDQLQTPLPTTT
ncbi:hypothetical protein FA13DRAFT_1714920 [Coprinellus micaceus]|uniref:Uncharacterized protein n=1 Tax=Coprinellus micaceus TaxID=71717 RepID=A0A4Y7SQ42_COPMI|nr:hypothetical protein FA13DRAFT_1714920 [Coprinellus micaceus]